MDLGIRGRTALISGASRGMAHATAQLLAREGVNLVMIARNGERLEAAAQAIRDETGVRVGTVAVDITTPEGRARALAACPDPDILITNADGPHPGDFRDWTRDDWIASIDALMLTPIELIKATVDGMMARKFGRIVNISARSVKIAQPELGLSNGPRSGLVGFVAGLARSTVKHNVTINSLLPGPFDSHAQRRHVEGLVKITGKPFEQIWEERMALNPAGRYGRVEEFAAYCGFLCSAHAGFITGQNLLIDGGQYPGTF
jgi:3-oxoacyl-[acyl-carrier protein] reductase